MSSRPMAEKHSCRVGRRVRGQMALGRWSLGARRLEVKRWTECQYGQAEGREMKGSSEPWRQRQQRCWRHLATHRQGGGEPGGVPPARAQKSVTPLAQQRCLQNTQVSQAPTMEKQHAGKQLMPTFLFLDAGACLRAVLIS